MYLKDVFMKKGVIVKRMMIVAYLLINLAVNAGEPAQIELQRDDIFMIDELEPSVGWDKITKYSLTEDSIWILEYRWGIDFEQSSQISRISLVMDEDKVTIAGQRLENCTEPFLQIRDFQTRGNDLYFLDLVPGVGNRLVKLSGNRPLQLVRHLKNCTITRCQTFANGSMLIKGVRMAPETMRRRAQLYEQWTQNAGFSHFVVNQDFSNVRPVAERSVPLHILDDQGKSKVAAQQGINEYTLGFEGSVAALFYLHQPGIRLIDDKGWQMALLFHPGEGMETIRVDADGEPLRNFVQVDVAVNDRDGHIIVADTINRTFWFVAFDNRILGKAPMPFRVLQMHLNKDGLYLLGREDQFGRYQYNLNPEKKPFRIDRPHRQ
jgi:hypothetical protein